MECFFQTQKNGWDGPVLGVKQATENKRQFDEEVEIHSDVTDFSVGVDGDVGGVYMWMLMRRSEPNHLQSPIVKFLGS